MRPGQRSRPLRPGHHSLAVAVADGVGVDSDRVGGSGSKEEQVQAHKVRVKGPDGPCAQGPCQGGHGDASCTVCMNVPMDGQ